MVHESEQGVKEMRLCGFLVFENYHLAALLLYVTCIAKTKQN